MRRSFITGLTAGAAVAGVAISMVFCTLPSLRLWLLVVRAPQRGA
ncbi:twin-arginine translocation signal domain-containing protein [Pannonibacter sp. SL95]